MSTKREVILMLNTVRYLTWYWLPFVYSLFRSKVKRLCYLWRSKNTIRWCSNWKFHELLVNIYTHMQMNVILCLSSLILALVRIKIKRSLLLIINYYIHDHHESSPKESCLFYLCQMLNHGSQAKQIIQNLFRFQRMVLGQSSWTPKHQLQTTEWNSQWTSMQ